MKIGNKLNTVEHSRRLRFIPSIYNDNITKTLVASKMDFIEMKKNRLDKHVRQLE